MIDIINIKIGEKVHYIPFEGCDKYENGIVKEIPEWSKDSIRVVYHCAGDWKSYMDYTSALTNVRDLFPGWKHSVIEVEDDI